MNAVRAEVLRILALTTRSRQLWWLAVATVILPAVGSYFLARFEGAPPLPDVAVWFAVVPFTPLIWAMAGVRWAETDQSHAAGALRGAWGTSRLSVWAAQLLTVAGLGLVGGLLSTLVMVLAVPAWRMGANAAAQAGAAWLVLSFAYSLMLTWGLVAAALVEGMWGTVLAMTLPVAGLLSDFIVGALALQPSSVVGPALLASFFATGPWGYFVNKASAIWGFGPYQAAVSWTSLTMGALIVLGTCTVVWRQLGGTRAVRIALLSAACLTAAATFLTGVQVAEVSTPSPVPSIPAGAAALGQARAERVRLSLAGASGIRAVAVLWPKAPGLRAVWLNPRLRVISFKVGGHPLRYRRSPAGWLSFAKETAPITISYAGNPLTVSRTYQGYPAVSSFVSAAGASLTAGSFYPVPSGTVAQPLHPPVLRFGLSVQGAGDLTVLSNLGPLRDGATRWRQTTGAKLVAGTLKATSMPGFTLWAGPSGASAWASRIWVPRYYPANFLGLLEAQTRAKSGSAAVVAVPWGALSTSLVALGNPNPVLAPGAYPAPTEMPGVFGFFQGLGQGYASVAVNWLGNADLLAQWAEWTPAWYDSGNRLGLPYPAVQLPAATALSAVTSWDFINGPVPPLNWTGSLLRRLTSVPKAERPAYLAALRRLLQGGAWPTWAEINRLAAEFGPAAP